MFVEYDNVMATLDPCCPAQFWSDLRSRVPKLSILRPSRDEGSLGMVFDAAEWQTIQGRTLVPGYRRARGCEGMNGGSEDGKVRTVLRGAYLLSSGVLIWSNSSRLCQRMHEVMQGDRLMKHEDTNDLQQNPGARQEDSNDLPQNPEAHQGGADENLEYQAVYHEDTGDLRQNPEAHQSFLYDVCQEHGASLRQDVYQEHGGPSHHVYVAQSVAERIDDRKQRLLPQRRNGTSLNDFAENAFAPSSSTTSWIKEKCDGRRLFLAGTLCAWNPVWDDKANHPNAEVHNLCQRGDEVPVQMPWGRKPSVEYTGHRPDCWQPPSQRQPQSFPDDEPHLQPWRAPWRRPVDRKSKR